MAVVYEQLLAWYVIALKLRETVESRFSKKSTYAGEIVPDYEPRPPKSEWVLSIEEKLAQGRQDNAPNSWAKLSIHRIPCHLKDGDMKAWVPKKSTYAGEIVPDYEPRPPKSEWVISIEEKLTRGRQDNVLNSWANLSIYRIPRYLKHGEDKAWVPQIVSLGPYHHGDEHLRHMERHKWRCLHRILERSGQGIGLYLDSVKKVERRARACYAGRISMSRNEFVDMMILDGCFVIDMFQGFAEGFEKLGYPPNDPVFSMRGSILQIQRDMIMLENQIPLFILDRLLGLQLGDPNQESVSKLALQFFSPLIGVPLTRVAVGAVIEYTMYPIHEDYCKRLGFDPLYDHGKVHCLEVVRRSLLHLSLDLERTKTKKWSQSQERITCCLSELQEAGIQIKWRSSSSWGDIHFKNGILEIPSIEIHEGMRSLFLNLIAFEQSHFNCSHYVTSYVIFMHNLINSPEDVQYLCNRRIIHHCLGSDAEVADLFHGLCQEVTFNPQGSYLEDIHMGLWAYYFGVYSLEVDDGVDTFCSTIRVIIAFFWGSWIALLTRKWNAWKVILNNKYFDNPWSIISLIAAFILLVLTFIQAFYAVYAYYRPRS